MRSDSSPPTGETTALTTWSAAQAIGIHAAPTPTSLSRSSRNASVELPRLNSSKTAEVPGEAPAQRRRGRHRPSRQGAPAERGGASGTGTSIATAIEAGDERQREQRPVLLGKEPEEQARQQRPRDGAGMIHRPMEAEDISPRRRVGPGREQRVARRGPNPLPDAVRQPHGQHVQPRRGQRHQRPDHRRNGVSRDDERLARTPPVGEPARDDLQDAVQRLGGALDHADGHRGAAERPRQVERHDRVDRLGRGVGEETGPRHQPHRPREARAVAEQAGQRRQRQAFR